MTDGAPGATWTLRGATLEGVESVADIWHRGLPVPSRRYEKRFRPAE